MCIASALAALALPAGAAPGGAQPGLPKAGVLVPGKSLAGLVIGMSKAQVRARWGADFGRCRSCWRETWYFTYRPFQPQGAAVELEHGRVVRLYTLWQPPGWRTSGGLALGAWESALGGSVGDLPRQSCGGYTVALLKGRRVWTAYYLYAGKLWGFGLTRAGIPPCV